MSHGYFAATAVWDLHMRLLLLTDDYLPHQGGSRVYYHNLLLSLSRAGVAEVRVVTRQRTGARAFDAGQPYAIGRVCLEEAPRLRRWRLQQAPVYVGLFQACGRAAMRGRPDVVLAGELVPTGPVGALWAFVLRRPLVVFTHAEGPSTLAKTRWQSRLARAVCRRAALVLAASDNARDGLVHQLGVDAGRVRVLLPAVGDEHFDERWLARPFSRASGPVRILTVGRLVARKGHLSVLQALAVLDQRGLSNFEYRVVGEGPMEGPIRRCTEDLGLNDRIRLLGARSAEDVLREYRDADLFVSPNRDDPATGDTEGFGIVFGEAAAHGLPVIGGLSGGTEHSIIHEETGLRIDGASPEAIAAALERFLCAPGEARRWGERGRERALREMRWEGRSRDFRNLLEDVVSRGRRTPARDCPR